MCEFVSDTSRFWNYVFKELWRKTEIFWFVKKINFLEKYNRDLSIMFGEIAIMVNHLAKLYDISLKFPLFINGSRSYILHGKEE